MAISSDIQDGLEKRLDAIEGLLPELRRLLTGLQQENLQIRTKTTHRDLVTKADLASEDTILHFLKSLFPMDGILAEESGSHEPGSSSGYSWCIDPVDGTVNYAHGLPLYSVSIGLLYQDEPAAGLVFLPALNDAYRAITGKGATKNGKKISVSSTSEISSALIVTGFPYNRAEMIDPIGRCIHDVLLTARDIRRTGSAALDLCWVAEGRFDGYYEWNLSPWDTSAGIVILREAGGLASELNGEPFRPGDPMIVAGGKGVHQQLLETLRASLK